MELKIQMKLLLSAAALAAGLVACAPAPTHAENEATPRHPTALRDLMEWQPEPYPGTDRLPPDYRGLDIWKTKDLLEAINRYTLRQEPGESDEDFLDRIASNDALAPFDFDADYAFLVGKGTGPNKNSIAFACMRPSAEEPSFDCITRFREFKEHHPKGIYGRESVMAAQVTEALTLEMSFEDLKGFGDHLRLYRDEKGASIVLETEGHDISPDQDLGILIVGKFTSPLMGLSQKIYEPDTRTWQIMSVNRDAHVPDVPYDVRYYSVPFSPTRAVAYLIETGEILVDVPVIEAVAGN